MCELASDLVRPRPRARAFVPTSLSLPAPSSPIRASHRHPTRNFRSCYLTPMESHPCTNSERNSHVITSLQKKRGGGGCRAHFPCQTLATAEPINRLGADRGRFHRRGLHRRGLDEAAAAAFGAERHDNAQYHDGED